MLESSYLYVRRFCLTRAARGAHPLPSRPVCENRRVLGSEVVRGLFQDGRQGTLEPKSNAPIVKAEVKVNTLIRGIQYTTPLTIAAHV